MNIGDKVIIKPRELKSDCDDYPCCYLLEMSDCYGDQVATIVDKKPMDTISISTYPNKKFWNGDPNIYWLDIDHRCYIWHSSMFYSHNVEKSNLDNIF